MMSEAELTSGAVKKTPVTNGTFNVVSIHNIFQTYSHHYCHFHVPFVSPSFRCFITLGKSATASTKSIDANKVTKATIPLLPPTADTVAPIKTGPTTKGTKATTTVKGDDATPPPPPPSSSSSKKVTSESGSKTSTAATTSTASKTTEKDSKVGPGSWTGITQVDKTDKDTETNGDNGSACSSDADCASAESCCAGHCKLSDKSKDTTSTSSSKTSSKSSSKDSSKQQPMTSTKTSTTTTATKSTSTSSDTKAVDTLDNKPTVYDPLRAEKPEK